MPTTTFRGVKSHRIRPGKPPKVKLNHAGQPREAFESLRMEDLREFARLRPCLVASPSCWYVQRADGTRISDAAHVSNKSRGTGDLGEIISLCRAHHTELHTFGQRSFERAHQIKLREAAGETWIAFETSQGKAL